VPVALIWAWDFSDSWKRRGLRHLLIAEHFDINTVSVDGLNNPRRAGDPAMVPVEFVIRW
jgi:hypothetical protein